MATTEKSAVVRLAAIGDLHCTKAHTGKLQPLFAHVAEHADVLALCGDLTDYGLPDEAHVLAHELAVASSIPIVGVLGNHDYESGHQADVTSILEDAGVKILDGESTEIEGVGFAGVKGFLGGFGRRTLGAWGEPGIKRFVQEAIDETLKLESALARLRTPRRIALLHYSPVRDTCEGEPLEIFPYLGCSRLEEPINRYRVTAVLHGHAHYGSLEGRTAAGVPVYNVALPLMRKAFKERNPLRILEIPVDGAAEPTEHNGEPPASYAK